MLPIQSNLDLNPNPNLTHQTTLSQYTRANLGMPLDAPLNKKTNIYRKGKKINI